SHPAPAGSRSRTARARCARIDWPGQPIGPPALRDDPRAPRSDPRATKIVTRFPAEGRAVSADRREIDISSRTNPPPAQLNPCEGEEIMPAQARRIVANDRDTIAPALADAEALLERAAALLVVAESASLRQRRSRTTRLRVPDEAIKTAIVAAEENPGAAEFL